MKIWKNAVSDIIRNSYSEATKTLTSFYPSMASISLMGIDYANF